VALRESIRRLYRRADQIVALSQGVADDLVRLDPALTSRTVVIHNACVDERVRAASARPVARDGVPAGRKLIVACGRLHRQKGFEHLLRAMAELRGRVPSHLWILGEGPERAALEGLARTLGIERDVTFLGFREDPYRFMAAGDVFVLSSLYEGFGNVVVEAMACGLPVVSTDCPHGPSEIITEGVNGLLVPPTDPAALAQALERVLRDDALRARLAEGSRQRARDFEAEAIAARYAEVFLSVAGR
jgi:glycosyltransferase involved in cell wall biosynthesis